MKRKSGIGEIQSAVLLTVIVLAVIAVFYTVAEERANVTKDELTTRFDKAKERAKELVAAGGLTCSSANGWWFMLHNYSYEQPLPLPFDEYLADGTQINDANFVYRDLDNNALTNSNVSPYTSSNPLIPRTSVVITIPSSVVLCSDTIVFITKSGGFFRIST